MNDIIDILNDLKERIEGQIKLFDRGSLVILEGSCRPLDANLRFSQLLHAQLIDINELIALSCPGGAPRRQSLH